MRLHNCLPPRPTSRFLHRQYLYLDALVSASVLGYCREYSYEVKCQLVRLWTMLLLGYPSLVWLGGMALVGGRATCSSAANHRTCRLLDQQHRPAAACQILYGLACRTDKHAVQQLLLVQSGLGGRYLVYHSRCITALRTGQILLSALAQG